MIDLCHDAPVQRASDTGEREKWLNSARTSRKQAERALVGMAAYVFPRLAVILTGSFGVVAVSSGII